MGQWCFRCRCKRCWSVYQSPWILVVGGAYIPGWWPVVGQLHLCFLITPPTGPPQGFSGTTLCWTCLCLSFCWAVSQFLLSSPVRADSSCVVFIQFSYVNRKKENGFWSEVANCSYLYTCQMQPPGAVLGNTTILMSWSYVPLQLILAHKA